MKYTHIIWDFNGTILDDVQVGIDSTNALMAKRGISLFASKDAYREVFGFPIIDYYKRIGFDFSKESYADVAVEWVEDYLSRVPEAGTYEGVVDVLKKVRRSGLGQIVLSATETSMLKKQIGMLGITDLFDEIYGLDNIHAHTKIAAAESWREKNPQARALFVGDTDHDLETARAINAECVLICGGHQSEQRLRRLGCRVVKTYKELEELIFAD